MMPAWQVLGLPLGLALLFRAWLCQKRRWRIGNLPTSRPRSLAMGLVGVAGRVELQGEPLLSPLFRTPCAWYRIRAAGWQNGGKTVIRDEEYGKPFDLADDSGRVRVDPWGALVRGTVVYDQFLEPGLITGELLLSFISRYNVPMSLSDGPVHIREWVLPLGQEIYILGEAGKAPDKLPPAEKRVKMLMKFWLEVPEHRAAIDMNKDGLIQTEEWDRALKHAWDHVRLQDLAKASEDRAAVLRKPRWGPFLITARGEKDALKLQGNPFAILFLAALALAPGWFWGRQEGWPPMAPAEIGTSLAVLALGLGVAFLQAQGRIHPAGFQPWRLRLDPIYGIMNSLGPTAREYKEERGKT